MNSIKLLVAIFVALFIAACGGGGGSAAPATPPVITPPATYNISGIISPALGVSPAAVSGVTVTLSGASSVVTTTSAAGAYSFTGLSNGSYTVKPTPTSNAFNPLSANVLVSGGNMTQNFTALAAAPGTFSINGTISGALSNGVTLNLSGSAVASTTSLTGGTYSFTSLAAGNYTVTPVATGYTFAPPSIVINSLAAASNGNNFVATLTPVAHALTGNVSTALSGVLITLTGTANASAVTDTSGNYSVNLFDGPYTVTPSKTGYTFSPNSTGITMAGAPYPSVNFAGTANALVKASVTGSVTGAWVQNVSIALSGGGQAGTTLTSAAGTYGFGNLPSGQTYTFTPTLKGYTFTPTSVSATIPAGSSAVIALSAVTATPVVTTTAPGAISGTVTYAGAKTGGVRVQAYYTNCTNCSPAAGSLTTLTAGTGNYIIRGIPTGTYNVIAQMDSLGTGQANANNPSSSAVSATVTGGVTTTANVTLVDPTIPAAVMPTGVYVTEGSGGGGVVYNAPTDANGNEIATSYNISWGPTTAATGGSASFPAQGTKQTVYFSSGLTSTNYVKMSACVGTTCSAASSAVGPTSPIGTFTISGTVSFTGTANTTAPMYVIIHNNGGGGSPFVAYATRIPGPLNSPVNYSITGVSAGTWKLSAIVDNNNNGLIDAGDFSDTNNQSPSIVVTGSATQNLTLPTTNSTANISTDNQYNVLNVPTNNYSVNASLNDGAKRIVAAVLFSGPNVAVPLDMGTGNGNGNFNVYDYIGATVPLVGDTYQFLVTYSDGTSQIISGSVTAILSSFATGLSVVNAIPNPTFSWTTPVLPPVGCLYSLNTYPNAGGSGWYYPNNSNGNTCVAGLTSVVYNVDGLAPPLTVGAAYGWQVQIKDANNNTATAIGTNFTH